MSSVLHNINRNRIIVNLSLILIFPALALFYFLKGERTIPLEVKIPEGSSPPDERVIALTFKKDDTLYSLLSTLQIPPARIAQLVDSARRVHDLGEVKAGTGIKVSLQGEDIKSLKLPVDDHHYLVVENHPDQAQGSGRFLARKEPIPYEERLALANGIIKTSLYEDGIKAGLDPGVIMDIADIFAWQIDFASDVKEGDSFRILYETRYLDGRFAGNGSILAAQFTNEGKTYTAIYFKGHNGRAGYYDADGHSLRRQFLKSPLNYRRISSYFSRTRFHPILKTYRPHHGVDYTAPPGTPVVSAGDGRVDFIGWKGGYGKLIVIRHNDVYSTAYGHLSRFKKGLSKGRMVSQNDVIGYVGSTGVSTGPHLHYEFRVRGRFVNPLTVKMPPATPIGRDEREEFDKVRAEIMARLEGEVKVAEVKP